MEVRRAEIVDPSTGEPLPGWTQKALYYLRSRTARFLLLIVLGFAAKWIGAEFTDEEGARVLDGIAEAIQAVGGICALYYNAKRRWQPPAEAPTDKQS